MNNKTLWLEKNLHLLISALIVIPAAIVYGSPSLLPIFIDIEIHSVDLSNLLKAVMVLYLAISLVWIRGICYPKYWQIATQSNLLFMSALAIGRTLSLTTDGIPSTVYVFGTFGEALLAAFAFYQLKKFSNRQLS